MRGPLVIGLLALALGGCSSAFHAPFDSAGNRAWVAGGHGNAWAYSVPVPGHGDMLGYFGSYFSTPGERRCQANRTNMLAAQRITSATECHPITVTEGGPLWGISLLNSDDGFVFRSRDDCEAGRRENDWSKAGYLPSACTPVSVTP